MKEKINVAFFLTRISKTGGITRVVNILINELVKNEALKIHLIGYQLSDDQPASYNWDERIIIHELTPTNRSMKIGILQGVPLKLRSYLQRYNIDILIATGQLVGIMAVLATVQTSTKLFFWSHSSFSDTKANKFKKISEYITAKYADLTISLTKEDEENYRLKTGARQVAQIYNPIDPKLLDRSPASYASESKNIISVGRLTREKNFTQLISIASIVLKQRPYANWHIYGAGPLKETLEKLIISNGLEDKVLLMGHVDDIYGKYPDYALLVMTSLFEGFPMTLVEAMTCKLPLVSFDIQTGPKEIIIEGFNGFLIPPFDEIEMAEKIITLLDDKELRKRFAFNNVSLMDQFHLESIVNKWLTHFKQFKSKETPQN